MASWLLVATDHDRDAPPAEATKLGMVTQPSGSRAGSVFTTQPQVRLLDAGNQPVLVAGVTITVTKHAGVAGTLLGTLTAMTDSFGIATFFGLSLNTEQAGASLDFTSSGLTGVTSTTFTVEAPLAPGSAVLTFEPDQYANQAALLAATGNWTPYGLTNAAPFLAAEEIEVNSGTVLLGTDGGYNGRSKYMRFFFPGGTGIERTIGRLMALNHVDSGQDVWIEWSERLSSNFKNSYSLNRQDYGVPAYKNVFMAFPSTGRFQQVFVYDDVTSTIGDAGNEVRGNFSYPNVMDGVWHLNRWHVKVSPTVGKHIINVDGVEAYAFTGNTGPSDKGEWYGFALGRNSNRGFLNDTTVDWGHCWIYTTDPGWGY